MKTRFFTVLAYSLFLLAGCTDNLGHEFSHLRAFLRISPVTALTPLHQALNNSGVYCTITYTSSAYIATRPDGTTAPPLPRTAMDAYGRPQCVEGFIIGTPSVPNTAGQFFQVCYDLVCPSCLDLDAVQRRLTFSEDETMRCPRCQRSYSLRNKGIPLEGENASRLKQYRMTYSGDVLIVNN